MTSQKAANAGTVTGAVFGGVVHWGDRPAVVDLDGGGRLGYARLAEIVRRAADGLTRRGLRPGDPVGLDLVISPVCLAAAYAVLTAGGVVTPVGGDTAVDAAHLSAHDVRLLLAAPRRTDAAVALAERSRVRQVIGLGEASGSTPLNGRLDGDTGAARIPAFPLSPESPALLPAGEPAPYDHRAILDRMRRLGRVIVPGDLDVVLIAGPPGDGAALLTVLSLALRHGATVLTAASMDLDQARQVLADQGVRFALLPAPVIRGLAVTPPARLPSTLAAAVSPAPPLIVTPAHPAVAPADAIV